MANGPLSSQRSMERQTTVACNYIKVKWTAFIESSSEIRQSKRTGHPSKLVCQSRCCPRHLQNTKAWSSVRTTPARSTTCRKWASLWGVGRAGCARKQCPVEALVFNSYSCDTERHQSRVQKINGSCIVAQDTHLRARFLSGSAGTVETSVSNAAGPGRLLRFNAAAPSTSHWRDPAQQKVVGNNQNLGQFPQLSSQTLTVFN